LARKKKKERERAMICKNGTEGYYKYDFGFEQEQPLIHISEHFSLNLLTTSNNTILELLHQARTTLPTVTCVTEDFEETYGAWLPCEARWKLG
jgi:hypothetical protein